MTKEQILDFYVYVHKRLSSGEVFYVGKGNGRRAWSLTGRSKYWHRVVKKYGHIIEIVSYGLQEWYAFELERELIALHGRANLVNMTDGGDGVSGLSHSAESRAAMSFAKIGTKLSTKTKSAMSASRIGKKRSAEAIAAVSAGKKGKSLSPKGYANIQAALSTPEVKARHRAAVIAALARPEVKEKHHAAIIAAQSRQDVRKNHRAALDRPDVRARHRSASGAKQILCVESGLIFETTCCAQKWLRLTKPKASGSNVFRACTGRCKKAYGYTWQYATQE